MHELSIAQSIVESARKELERAPEFGRLKEIGVRVGALSGVLSDSLSFCFDAITAGTDLEGCRLSIEDLGVVARCNECAQSFDVEQFLFACPVCQSGAVDVLQGYELEIAYLEVDEPDLSPSPVTTNGVHYVDEDPP